MLAVFQVQSLMLGVQESSEKKVLNASDANDLIVILSLSKIKRMTMLGCKPCVIKCAWPCCFEF